MSPCRAYTGPTIIDFDPFVVLMEKLFLFTVAALEVGAALAYAWQGNPRLGFIWACYAAATVALAGVK